MKYKIGDKVKIKENGIYIFYEQERLREINYVGTVRRVVEDFFIFLKKLNIIGEKKI